MSSWIERSIVARGQMRGTSRVLLVLFAALLALIGLVLVAGGIWLITLSGSWYYLLAGIGLILSAFFIFAGRTAGVWIYLAVYVLTWLWAVWEVGFDGWALLPRVFAPSILAVLALLCLPALSRHERRLAAIPERDPTAPVNRRAILSPAGARLATSAGVVIVLLLTGVMGLNLAEGATGPMQMPAAATSAAPADAVSGADWTAWGGTYKALRYSSLDQITPENVGRLQRVWTYRTGDMPDAQTAGKYSPENTPLKVGDRLYLCSAKNIVIALDAATGKEVWRYDPKVPDAAIPYGATCRGVVYYRSPSATAGSVCANRIIEGTLDARLIAVDAEDGKPCSDFGKDGAVDLSEGIGETVPGWYGNVAAPTIVRGIVVMGAQVQDGQAADAPSGVIRGYDAVTGKLAWAWDMGHPDWHGAPPPPGETYTRGTPNMWTSAAGDEALGYVYIPLGNAANDYYGAARSKVEDEYNSSVVAIDVTTGKPVWHFQTVHHDLWDYDLGSQPTLVDLQVNGATVPALIQPSKQGEIYVLDRRTGKSLFPVEERKAPTGGIEPERLSPTQPYSGYASVAFPRLREADMWGMSPLDQMWCRIQFRAATYDGEYTPPHLDNEYLEYPGYNGGSDWGSVAVDPERGILVANYNNMANYNRLIPRAEADALGLRPINAPKKSDGGPHNAATGYNEYGPQAGAPVAIRDNPGWRSFTGLLCTRPPYGGIRAIDLATGKTIWDRPLGEALNNGPFGIPSMLPIDIGTPNNGGAVLTKSGLIFIAAATDDLIRAIDIRTGKVLWTDKLPAGGQATPMTFEVGGRQYIGFMAGGHHFMGTPIGDYVLAYALPPA